jgi:hypothetical protein
MSRLAIMQPYFLPYIGYWQLIHAADCFVLFDDAQYMRHGWVNRNRILKPGGGWQYILVPLKSHELKDPIKNVHAHPDKNWRELILGQLAHYKKKARYFDETIEILRKFLFGSEDQSIAAINSYMIRSICSYLHINTEIILSSDKNFDYSKVGDAGEWALRITEQMGASEYINPISGAKLFDSGKFSNSNIKLSFLKTDEIIYSQRDSFEPFLSIIDVLMFNGKEGTQELLTKYTIGSAQI